MDPGEYVVSETVAAPAAETVQVDITPVRLTYLRVRVDGSTEPIFDDWLDPSHPPLSFHGKHVTMRVLDRGAVQITKNGAALATGDADITFE